MTLVVGDGGQQQLSPITLRSRFRPFVASDGGLLARFSPIRGITPAGALDRKIWLPAVLNTFTVSESALHNEYDTLTGGHFSMAAMGGSSARQFRTMSVDSLTIDWHAGWLVKHGQNVDELRTRLYEIMRYRKPVYLLVTFHPSKGRPAEFAGNVTIRSVSKDVRPGEPDTRYMTLSISDWRDPSTGRRTSQGSRAAGVALPTTHKLKATDTLSSLSYAYYGRYDFWRDIRAANGISARWGQQTPLVNMPGRWQVGYNVKIPALTAAELGTVKGS